MSGINSLSFVAHECSFHICPCVALLSEEKDGIVPGTNEACEGNPNIGCGRLSVVLAGFPGFVAGHDSESPYIARIGGPMERSLHPGDRRCYVHAVSRPAIRHYFFQQRHRTFGDVSAAGEICQGSSEGGQRFVDSNSSKMLFPRTAPADPVYSLVSETNANFACQVFYIVGVDYPAKQGGRF